MSSSNDHPSSSSHTPPYARRNEQITARTVRLLSEDGKDLGIMKTEDARKIASSAGQDLVEVASTAVPPVCKVFHFAAWAKIRSN
jgi:translation initiation factor IF-3